MVGTHSGTRDVYELINGPVSPQSPPIDAQIIVNPMQAGPTGWGSPNVQQFQSSHTNALQTNESAEQGFGVGPERAWAHYPHVSNPNPFRRMASFLRDGGDSYSTLVYRPEVVAFWQQALLHEAAAVPVKHPMRPDPVLNQAPSMPYVQAVPTSPGGYYG